MPSVFSQSGNSPLPDSNHGQCFLFSLGSHFGPRLLPVCSLLPSLPHRTQIQMSQLSLPDSLPLFKLNNRSTCPPPIHLTLMSPGIYVFVTVMENGLWSLMPKTSLYSASDLSSVPSFPDLSDPPHCQNRYLTIALTLISLLLSPPHHIHKAPLVLQGRHPLL